MTSQRFSTASAYPNRSREIADGWQKYFTDSAAVLLQITVAEQSAQASQEQQFWVCTISICHEVQ